MAKLVRRKRGGTVGVLRTRTVLVTGARTEKAAKRKATRYRNFNQVPVTVKKFKKSRAGDTHGVFATITIPG